MSSHFPPEWFAAGVVDAASAADFARYAAATPERPARHWKWIAFRDWSEEREPLSAAECELAYALGEAEALEARAGNGTSAQRPASSMDDEDVPDPSLPPPSLRNAPSALTPTSEEAARDESVAADAASERSDERSRSSVRARRRGSRPSACVSASEPGAAPLTARGLVLAISSQRARKAALLEAHAGGSGTFVE